MIALYKFEKRIYFVYGGVKVWDSIRVNQTM